LFYCKDDLILHTPEDLLFFFHVPGTEHLKLQQRKWMCIGDYY